MILHGRLTNETISLKLTTLCKKFKNTGFQIIVRNEAGLKRPLLLSSCSRHHLLVAWHLEVALLLLSRYAANLRHRGRLPGQYQAPAIQNLLILPATKIWFNWIFIVINHAMKAFSSEMCLLHSSIFSNIM